MTATPHFIPNFEIRSVLLLAALTVGTAWTVRAQTAPEPARSANSVNAPAVQNIATRPAPTAQDIDAAFGRADTNKDARLSRQEAARFPAVEQRFDQIDTNRDDAVSREEFEEALKS